MNKKIIILSVSLIIFLVLAAIFLFTTSGSLRFDLFNEENEPHYFGIAVDSHDEIYLAGIGKITVIDNEGNYLRSLDVNDERGYTFNIINDMIFLESQSGYYITDLYGNELDVPLSDTEKHSLQIRSMSHFTTADGTEYYIRFNHVYMTEDRKTKKIY